MSMLEMSKKLLAAAQLASGVVTAQVQPQETNEDRLNKVLGNLQRCKNDLSNTTGIIDHIENINADKLSRLSRSINQISLEFDKVINLTNEIIKESHK